MLSQTITVKNNNISSSDDKVLNFLMSRKTKKGEIHTHTSMYDAKIKLGLAGSFLVFDDDSEELYQLLGFEIFKKKKKFFLIEKHKEIGPIIIDIDLRYSKDFELEDERIYNKDSIIKLVSIYFNEITKFLIIEDKYKKCYIHEKKKPYEYNDLLMKDGFHIIFPNIVTTPEIQFKIRENVLKSVECIELFQNLNVLNKIDDIIDERVIKSNGWFMYGCFKPGNEPYLLTLILKANINNDIEETELDENLLEDENKIKLFSIRNKDKLTDLTPYAKEVEEKEKEKEKQKDKQLISSKKKNSIQKEKRKNTTEDISLVRQFIKILSIERTEKYYLWIEVGWCLFNIDYRLLEDWIEFSKRTDKYNNCKEECSKLWETFIQKDLGIASLIYWCKQDNKVCYNEIMQKDLLEKNVSKTECTTYDIGLTVYKLYKTEFVCSSLKHDSWYQFINHKWEQIDSAVTLKKNISNKVVDMYLNLAGICYRKSANALSDSPEKELYLTQATKLTEISKKLKNITFKRQVVAECAELFYIKKFEEKLDCNLELIAFKNGVYDLENFEFRDGRPEDYISLSTNIDYDGETDFSEEIKEIKLFFKQVYPNENVSNYVLTLLASFLNGSTGNEKFHVFTGTGGNGKSKVIELYESVIGDYSVKLPHTVITQKRPSSNSSTPEIIRTKGKRFACLQEPDENEKIQVGFMKELTGGDKIVARGLFKDPIEFKPQFKMVLTCNKLPRIQGNDGGTWRRIRVLDHPSRFVENPKASNEYLIDIELSEKMIKWRQPFIQLLMEYYKIYKKGDIKKGIQPGIKEPPEVLYVTENYRKFNDIYAEFISEYIEENPNGLVKIEEIYAIFKKWYKDAYSESKVPVRKELKDYMEKMYGVYGVGKKSGFRGIQIINKDDDDEDETEEPGKQQYL
jgi:P4 family phage/plasmid primase-like protien